MQKHSLVGWGSSGEGQTPADVGGGEKSLALLGVTRLVRNRVGVGKAIQGKGTAPEKGREGYIVGEGALALVQSGQ